MTPEQQELVRLRKYVTDLEQRMWSRVAGTVVAVNGGTVDVAGPGGVVPDLRYQDGATPTVGQQCWIFLVGSQAMDVQLLA